MSLTDHMGLPLQDAIVVVDDAYRRWGVRERISIIGAGRIVTGAEAAFTLALGADMVNIGRGFLFSIGCIQALRCHTNECPTGVATQSAWRQRGLVRLEGASEAEESVAGGHGFSVPDRRRRRHREVRP